MAQFPGIYRSPYGDSIAELLMRQGDIAARGAEQSGQIWSQAINQLGQIGAGAVQDYQQRKAQKQREEQFNAALSSWDPADPGTFYRGVATAYGPEMATSALRAMSALEESKKKSEPDPKLFQPKAEFIGKVWKANPDWVKQNWGGIAQTLGPEAKALYGFDLTPEWDDSFGQVLDSLGPEVKPEAGFSLSPGETRFDASGKPVASLPAAPKAEAAPKPGSFEAFVAANPNKDVLQLRAQWEAAGRAPKEAPKPEPERVFNPEGVVLSSYGVREKEDVRREARERGIPVFENVTAQNKGMTLAGIVADAQELTTLFAEPEVRDAIGPVAGRWSKLKGKVVDLPPKVQRALQLMTSLSDTELRKRSGAQINDKEMQRLLQFTTDPKGTLGHNLTAVAGLLKSADRDYRALSGQGASGEVSEPTWTEMGGGKIRELP